METANTAAADACVTSSAFAALLGRPDTPLILDVRRSEAFAASGVMLPLARRCAPEKLPSLLRSKPVQSVIAYCVYGHAVSQGAAAQLRAAGWDARYLLGGIEGGEPGVDAPDLLALLKASPPPVIGKRPDLGVTGSGASRWITRSRPKIDRIACPWLIRRFIDRDAVFAYAPTAEVPERARALQAVAFDMPGAPISHEGERCSFDSLLGAFDLRRPALDLLALIVRGADTDRLELAAPAAGLLAVSLGMSQLHADDDFAMLEAMMPVYDALYAWCGAQVAGRIEAHSWKSA
jgi:rhodanese-related sulfurtransferase